MMQWFKNLKMGTKLILGFLVVSLIGTMIGLQGIYQASQMNNISKQMYEEETLGMQKLSEANLNMLEASRALRSAMLSTTVEDRKENIAKITARFKQVHDFLDGAGKYFTSDNERDILNKLRVAIKDAEQADMEVVRRLESEPLGIARESTSYLFTTARPVLNKADALMTEMLEGKVTASERMYIESGEIYSSIRWVLASITLVGLIAGVLIGMSLSKHIGKQIGGEPKDVADMANNIAKGDLSVAINTANVDKGSVVYAMSLMQDALANVVSTVRASSDGIAAGATQIAHGNTDLSSRTEQQAASLQQTAASIEEITSTVRQTADNARQANTLATEASRTAEEGRAVVNQVVETMQGINESSQRISNIINVIDSIAFQTNILALNASVEAARAGEQGRGFAVVAGEVRNLASRSADAAREIKGLIEDSTRRAQEGSKQVEQAGQTIGNMVSAVRRVTDIIDEISAASQEQSEGISQVNTAVAQMDQVTQQNAGLVQEATVASSSLAGEAQSLSDVVAIFRLGGEATRNHAAPRKSPNSNKSAVRPLVHRTASAAPAPKAKTATNDWDTF